MIEAMEMFLRTNCYKLHFCHLLTGYMSANLKILSRYCPLKQMVNSALLLPVDANLDAQSCQCGIPVEH